MGLNFITFRSVTYAQRGERVLNSAGIRCTLQRTPRFMEEQGCGYALKLRGGDVRAAAEVLRKNQVAWRKAYVRRENGEWEEISV